MNPKKFFGIPDSQFNYYTLLVTPLVRFEMVSIITNKKTLFAGLVLDFSPKKDLLKTLKKLI